MDVLLKAYAQVDSEQTHLTIAGDGPLYHPLKLLSQELNIQNITWLGRIAPTAVKEHLHSSIANIVPSLWNENCSMSIMESLASGTPCIVSDSGGNPELVEHGKNGYIFPSGKIEALIEALQQPQDLLTMSDSAMQRAIRLYSPQAHFQQLIQVYEEAINANTLMIKSSAR